MVSSYKSLNASTRSLPRPRSSYTESEIPPNERNRLRRQIESAHSDSHLEQTQGNVQQYIGRDFDEFNHEIKGLKAKLGEYVKQNEILTEKLAESDRKNENMEGELRKLEQVNKQLEEQGKTTQESENQYSQLVNHYQQLSQYYKTLEATVSRKDSEITILKQNEANWKHHYNQVHNRSKQQALQITELQRETEKQRFHITELTETISRSSQISTTTRDDDYYSGAFTRLAGSIRKWVLRYFDPSDTPEFTHQDLPLNLPYFLKQTLLGYNTTPSSNVTIGRKEIEAVITQALIYWIFNSNFVFSVYDLPPRSHKGLPGVSDLQHQKWYAQTTDMFIKHESFADHSKNTVRDKANELQSYFSSLSKNGTEETRQKTLLSIVEQASTLAIDVSRQLSFFEILEITPGMPYDPDIMDDMSGNNDGDDDDDDDDDDDEEVGGDGVEVNVDREDEEGTNEAAKRGVQIKREFIVSMILSPPILRWDFDDMGKFQESPIIVRKGVVNSVPSEVNHGNATAETELL